MNEFLAQGYCFYWQPGVVWLNVISDLIISIAFISIASTIFFVVHKKKNLINFRWLILVFAAFLFLCGVIHMLELIGVWKGFYYLEGIVKLITAAISIATAILIFPLIPSLLENNDKVEDGDIRSKDKL